jgi:pimeloyl-ACP methyl ester carboxylesterase
VVLPLSLVLLVVAVTWDGRVFAVAALLIGLVPLLGAQAWISKSRQLFRGAIVLSATCVIVSAVVAWRAPSGKVLARSSAMHVYANGEWRFRRFALGNLLPEVDQLMLGYTLMPVADPLLTLKQSGELKGYSLPIYRELERDPDFRVLGSVMPEVYRDLLGLPFEQGHSLLYIPAGIDRSKPCSVLVFFHGSGGNFKAYLWLLTRVAERRQLVVVAPSFGMGNWRLPETQRVLDGALAEVSRVVNINRRDVHLLGLSNGGLAVSQLAGTAGARFRTFVFLSPVFDAAAIQTTAFAEQCRERPIFVYTGRNDDRVPLRYVEQSAAEMTQAGARVTVESVDGADHFLVFSHRVLVLDRLDQWLRENRAAE